MIDCQGVSSAEQLQPGQRVSVDHFVSSTKGRLYEGYGKANPDEMYCGGCLFYDHASKLIHIEHQTHLNTHQTLEAKKSFEAMAADRGVIPQSYMSDNVSAFTSAGFADHLRTFAQVIRFAGVGAHHHNGNAERAIQTIMSIARTMMLHAAIHWPDIADTSLWTMAVDYAIYLYNHLPDPETGLSPIDIFSKTRWEQKRLHHLHVWGCPAYVLDKTIADGKKEPR